MFLMRKILLLWLPVDVFPGSRYSQPQGNISARNFTDARQTQYVLFWAPFTLFAPNKYSTLWIIPQRTTQPAWGEAENSPEHVWESGRQQSVSRAAGWKACPNHWAHTTVSSRVIQLMDFWTRSLCSKPVNMSVHDWSSRLYKLLLTACLDWATKCCR